MSSKTLWIGLLCMALCSGTGGAQNFSPPYYTGQILPTPQEAHYGDAFVELGATGDEKASACLVIGKGLNPESPAVAELVARVQEFGGTIDVATDAEAKHYTTAIRLGTYDGGEVTPPEKPEGYAIDMVARDDRYEVHAVGHDAQGTYWACRSLIQLMTRRGKDVVLRRATIRDFPHVARRGFLMPMFRGDAYHLSWAATYKLNCVAPGMVVADWRAPTDAELSAMQRVGRYLRARGIE
ncbi:MAG: hypothetical protein KAW89_07075, partial [Armatimonadetes bacterium]|nr:hypothetical protein [Armatimonadota bacterium]